MDLSMQNQEDMPCPCPMVLHEGHHDILDGVEDLDEVFGVEKEENDPEHSKKKSKIEKAKKSKEIKKEKGNKQLPQ